MITVKTFETAAPGADLDIVFKARNEPSRFSQACGVPISHLLTMGSHLFSRRRPQVLQVVSGLLHDCENFTKVSSDL